MIIFKTFIKFMEDYYLDEFGFCDEFTVGFDAQDVFDVWYNRLTRDQMEVFAKQYGLYCFDAGMSVNKKEVAKC